MHLKGAIDKRRNPTYRLLHTPMLTKRCGHTFGPDNSIALLYS